MYLENIYRCIWRIYNIRPTQVSTVVSRRGASLPKESCARIVAAEMDLWVCAV
jgi:hypothetical protein